MFHQQKRHLEMSSYHLLVLAPVSVHQSQCWNCRQCWQDKWRLSTTCLRVDWHLRDSINGMRPEKRKKTYTYYFVTKFSKFNAHLSDIVKSFKNTCFYASTENVTSSKKKKKQRNVCRISYFLFGNMHKSTDRHWRLCLNDRTKKCIIFLIPHWKRNEKDWIIYQSKLAQFSHYIYSS